MKAQNKRLLFAGVGILALLSIPLIAMQFTTEVNWSLSDFMIMGSLLASIALGYELIVRKNESIMYRAAFGIGLLGAFLLLWVNAAVGIIGNEGQEANLLFGIPLGIGLVGSLFARFKARGMAITLFLAAGVQMLIPAISLMIWPPSTISWSPSVLGVFLLTGFFAVLFFISGMLFRKVSLSK